MEAKNLNTLYKYETQYSADSVEWCPHDNVKNLFVCANYFLKENDSQDSTPERIGKILLFSVTPSDGLQLQQSLDTAAVLDQKWCHIKVDGNILLGIVNAKSTLEVYKLNTESTKIELLTEYIIQSDEKENLLLSLDWSTGKYETAEPEIVCSDSNGNIHLFKFVNNNLILEYTLHGHDFEAWISGFYYWDPNVIFSGGDDSVFCQFDKRCGDSALRKSRCHEAGVTAFHSNSSKEYIVASGSYDENIRLWDIRQLKNPINTIKMPGTLWRLKWDPFKNTCLLAACMLGGVHIVDCSDITNLSIVGSYYEHKNISYGADWSFMNSEEVKEYGGSGKLMIGTCSFYDRLLCISQFDYDLKVNIDL